MRHVQLVEHERLHLICFNCKEFGLREGSCPRAATMEVQVEPESRPSLASVTNAALEAKRATWADKNSLSGPWILPKKPIRHKLVGQIGAKPAEPKISLQTAAR